MPEKANPPVVGVAVANAAQDDSPRNMRMAAYHRLIAACAVYDVNPRDAMATRALIDRGLLGHWITTGGSSHHFPTEARIAQALANIQELGEEQALAVETGRGDISEFAWLPPSRLCVS
jgi:hypothetical protein